MKVLFTLYIVYYSAVWGTAPPYAIVLRQHVDRDTCRKASIVVENTQKRHITSVGCIKEDWFQPYMIKNSNFFS